MGRDYRKKAATGRDAGGFVALPWAVLDSAAYARLSHPARGLLLEFARQYVRDNNGRLLASEAYLAKRGWKSNDTIDRAKRKLIEAGFIHETVKGHRPNKASWYAVTWFALDKLPGYDVGAAECFERGAYRKNASLTPSHGVESPAIAPSHGVESAPPTPPDGAIRAVFARPPTPPDGDHLEMPSTRKHNEGTTDSKGSDQRTTKPSAAPRRYRPGSDCALVLDALATGPKSTADLKALGVARPPARVHELKKRGYAISKEKAGKISRYALAAAPSAHQQQPETEAAL